MSALDEAAKAVKSLIRTAGERWAEIDLADIAPLLAPFFLAPAALEKGKGSGVDFMDVKGILKDAPAAQPVVDVEAAHEAAMIELSERHPYLNPQSVDITEATIMHHLHARCTNAATVRASVLEEVERDLTGPWWIEAEKDGRVRVGFISDVLSHVRALNPKEHSE